MAGETPPANGKQALLSALLTGDNSMKLVTIILIVVSGGANFLGTKQVSADVNLERDRAVRQIADLHDALDEFELRQKALLKGMDTALANQTTMLKNQNSMIEELHKDHTQQ